MPPRASGAAPPSDPMYIGNLWTLVQMVMARGCMPEEDARKEFARVTGKAATDLFDQALSRENLELVRLQLTLRRVVSPLTGRAHVGLCNMSSDAPAKAVGSRYSHAQREFFARVLEVIATDPNATNGVCSAPVTRLLNLDLSQPSSIGAGMAVAAAAAPAATPTKGGKGKGKNGGAAGGGAVKRNPQSDDADGTGDADDGRGGAAGGVDEETAAARRRAQEDDEEERRRAEAREAARLAADAVRRMSLREREETLSSLAHEGWLEAREDVAGHYCVGPRSFLELSTYLLKMDLADSTRDAWDGLVG